jgi:hypothetical protein
MRPYFTRERFGRPQFFAGLLLAAFLAQAAWLVRIELIVNSNPAWYGPEGSRIAAGWLQWHGEEVAGQPYSNRRGSSHPEGFDVQHSPLLALISSAPLLIWQSCSPAFCRYWLCLPRLPFLACGVFLGASLWYVARRLCGNAGGFIALTFYCFSPSLIQASALWQDSEPNIVAAWGAFGTIFTSIAVAHTLYAPREVVLWNWRRIVLLAISLTIAVGAQFSMIVLLPLALLFLLYVAPVRRCAAAVIWLAACGLGTVLLFGVYFFHPHAFAGSLHRAMFWGATWRGFMIVGVYRQVVLQILRACPALLLALPVAVITYSVWPRTRYFGNTAPLLLAALFFALAMAHPDPSGPGFLLAAIPFLFVFVAGVLADLRATRYRSLVTACIVALLAAYIVRTLFALAHVPLG